MPGDTSGPRSPREPVRVVQDEPGRPPHDRVRGVLQVDDPRVAPGAGRPVQVGRLVGEAHGPPVVVDRQPLRRAGLPVLDEPAPQLVEVRRPGPQHPVGAVPDVGLPAEGGLPAERAEALAEDVAAAGGGRRAGPPRRRTPRRRARGPRPAPWPGRRGTTSSWAGRSTASPPWRCRRSSRTRASRWPPGRPSPSRSWWRRREPRGRTRRHAPGRGRRALRGPPRRRRTPGPT